MIIILRPDTDIESAEGKAVLDFLAARPGIIPQVHSVTGTGRVLTEIYAIIIGVAADNPIISRNPDDTLDRRQARHFLRIE